MLKKRPQGIGSSMHSRETSRTKMLTCSGKAVDRETCTRLKLLERDSQFCSETITNIFKPRDSCYNFRNSNFLLPRFKTVSFGKYFLRYLGPTLRSKLDKNDKTCKSLSEFRNRIRNKDLTFLIDDRCKACLLCDS